MDTNIIYSISSKPGNFGTTVHNAGFSFLNIRYVYKAIKIANLKDTVNSLRNLEVRGCSVSMPYKKDILKYLDEIDNLAKLSGAVNTVINNNGKLKGYNTDVISCYKSLLKSKISKEDKILLLGSGGVARATLVALNKLKLKNIIISSRNKKTMLELKKLFNVSIINWEDLNNSKAKVLINATPIGMKPMINQIPVNNKKITDFSLIIDFVASPLVTKLINLGRKRKIICIDGFTLTLNQALEQFRLYTNKKPPIKIMTKAAKSLL